MSNMEYAIKTRDCKKIHMATHEVIKWSAIQLVLWNWKQNVLGKNDQETNQPKYNEWLKNNNNNNNFGFL